MFVLQQLNIAFFQELCYIFCGDFMNKETKGTISILLATMIWGSAFVAQSLGMDYIDPFTFQAIRCIIAAITLVPVVILADRGKKDGKTFWSRWKDKKLWVGGIYASIPLFFAVCLQQIGLVSTEAGKSAFLTALYIVMVPILGVFFGRKPSKLIGISVCFAVLGLYFLSGADFSNFQFGDICLIGCAIAFGVQIIIVDRFALHVDAIRMNMIQSLFCGLISLIPMFIFETPEINNILNCWFPLLYTGFMSMGIAYSLQIIGQKSVEPSRAALIMSMESVFAVLFGWIFLGEKLSFHENIGCNLMMIAIFVCQYHRKGK